MGNTFTWYPVAPRGLGRAGLLCLCLAAVGIVLAVGVPPALAKGKTAKKSSNPGKKLIDLNKKALADLDAGEFDVARDALLEAVKVAESAGMLQDKMLARTYVHLGAVTFLGYKDRKGALRYFGKAKEIREDIQLTPSLETPALLDLFAKAKPGGTGEELPASKPATKTAPQLTPTPRVPVATPTLPDSPPSSVPQELDVPAVLPSDLYCPAVEEGIEGHDVTIRCAVNPSLKAERILLFYRASGAPTYKVAAMQIGDRGWQVASIPADQVKGESMQYYCEARDSDDNILATNGQEDLPNPIMIRPDTSAPVVARPGSGKGDGEDPLDKWKKDRDRAEAEVYLHRRRRGAFWVGASAGTGYGYHLASRYEWRRDADPVGKGTHVAGLITMYPEIGYLVTDHFGVAVQGRIEYIPIEGSGDTTPGRPASGAYSVLARALYYLDLGVGNAQVQFSADFGGGEGYRFHFPPTNPKGDKYWDPRTRGDCTDPAFCAKKPTLLTDTIRSGPIIYGAGAGFIYHFTSHIAANVEVRVLGAGPHFGLLGEVYGSFQVSFGGRAPEPSAADAPPRTRREDQEEEEE